MLRTLNCLWTRATSSGLWTVARTDDGSPLVQLCEVCTAAKTSAEIAVTPATPTINAINGRSHRCADRRNRSVTRRVSR